MGPLTQCHLPKGVGCTRCWQRQGDDIWFVVYIIHHCKNKFRASIQEQICKKWLCDWVVACLAGAVCCHFKCRMTPSPQAFSFMVSTRLPTCDVAFDIRRPQFNSRLPIRVINDNDFKRAIILEIDNQWCGFDFSIDGANVDLPHRITGISIDNSHPSM